MWWRQGECQGPPPLRASCLSDLLPCPSPHVGSCLLPTTVGPRASVQRALPTGKGLLQPGLAAPSGGSHPSTPRQGRVTEDPELQREALPLRHQLCSSHTPTPPEDRECAVREVPSPHSTPVSPGPQGSASCHRRATETHSAAHRHDSAQGREDELQWAPCSARHREPSWTSDRHD